MRFVSTAIFLWAGFTQAVFSADNDSGKLIITVEVELAGQKPKPLANAFISIPILKDVGGDSTLGAWLKENAKLPGPRVHTFIIKDKQLFPLYSIAYVGDSVCRTADKEVLDIGIFDNSPDTGMGPNYRFYRAERIPISLKSMLHPECRPARMLVSDHTVNSITGENGRVEFLNLPRIENLPFRIWAFSEDEETVFQFSSSSLKFTSAKGRFEVDTRTSDNEHKIRAVLMKRQK